MTTHSYHPDAHIYGLQDSCPRCMEHAKNPLKSLDVTMLAGLQNRIDQELAPRSSAEWLAIKRLKEAQENDAVASKEANLERWL